ncbi:MAG: AraC family transcriptional regulator [Eubacteriales bacterium]|nr:AraC family transcriptional regulator [Eubacteriales bacterium]
MENEKRRTKQEICDKDSLSYKIIRSFVIQSDIDLSTDSNDKVVLLFGTRNNSKLFIDDAQYDLFDGSFASIYGERNIRLANVCGSVFAILLIKCDYEARDFSIVEAMRVSPTVADIFDPKYTFYTVPNVYSIYTLLLEIMFESGYMIDNDRSVMERLVTAMLIRIGNQSNTHYGRKPDYAANAKQYIQEHYQEELDAQFLADRQWISKSYMQASFKNSVGCTINEYITRIRIEHAKEMLSSGDLSATDVAFLCGFNNRQWFTHVFEQAVGVSPREYKKIGKKEETQDDGFH